MAEKEKFEQITPAKIPREDSFRPAEEKNTEELAELREERATQRKALLTTLKEKTINRLSRLGSLSRIMRNNRPRQSLSKASISVHHEQSLPDTHLELKQELEDLRDRLTQEHQANLTKSEARLSEDHRLQVQLLHLKYDEDLHS